MKRELAAELVVLLMIVSTFSTILVTATQASGQNSLVADVSPSQQIQTYGTGLSGAPVVMDLSTLGSLEGNPPSVRNMELNITRYYVPIAINLVFLDPGWGNQANTSAGPVAGGRSQLVADWLSLGVKYGIKTIFFFKQFGYYFSTPSWDQSFLNAYPGAATVGSNGVNVPLSNCAGCTTSSGWTITSPEVYRQLEQDLKQFYAWYGSYSSWVGFGEGATGDRNDYGNLGTTVKTSRPWDNGTIYDFANSVFFQRNVDQNGAYQSTGTLSKVWSMFLQDRPDIALTTGVPLVYPGTFSIYGGTSGSFILQRFFVPWGESLSGFVLKSYLSAPGSPSAPLLVTIYPDETDNPIGPGNGPILNHPLQSASISSSGVSAAGGWVSASFSASLVGGDYYWAGFTSSTGSSSAYQVTFDQQNVFPDIGIQASNSGPGNLAAQPGGSVLWLTSRQGATVSVYPYLTQGPNQNGGTVYFQVDQPTNVNTVSFMFSDRAYDPNPISLLLERASDSSVLATGTLSLSAQRGVSTISELPIQLSKTVTLQPGVRYQIVESQLPSGDNYAGSSGTGVSQDFITTTANPPSAGYLGQGTWPAMMLGLMTVEPNGISNYNYLGATDLQYSPGENGNNEVALRFTAPGTGALKSFTVEVIAAASSSNTFTVALRPDNLACLTSMPGTCSHPSGASTNLATGSISFSSVNSTFKSCSGAFAGRCAWATVTFSGETSLVGDTNYWLVMSTSGGQYMQLERLVGPYSGLVYVSPDDFATKWGPPNDGPTDIAYSIITSAGSVNNLVQGDVKLPLGTVAQSFQSPTSFQLKGIWVPTSIGSPAEVLVTVYTDGGSDSPSKTALASGRIQENTPGNSLNYASLNVPVNITAGTKYWFTMSFICEAAHCSSSPSTTAVVYRSNAANMSYGGGGLHYEVSTGSSWSTPAQGGSIVFVLAASDAPIKTYSTSTLYKEISTLDVNPLGGKPAGWNQFLNYEQSSMMYNLSEFLTSYSGRQMVWYTGMAPGIIESIPNFNGSYVLVGDSGAGGPIGCPPSEVLCGGSQSFWGDDATTHVINSLGFTPQSNWVPWSSFGFTQDNRGSLTPTDTRTDLLFGVPINSKNPVSFSDGYPGFPYNGLYNMTQTQYYRSFGSLLARMEDTGGFFGTGKNAIRVLWIGSVDDGLFPSFLTPAMSLTIVQSNGADQNLTRFGDLSQFNVIVGGLTSPTPSFLGRLNAFVAKGGGWVSTSFGDSPGQSNKLLGLQSSSATANPTSTLTIVQPNKITSPYSSISYSAYWLRYSISPMQGSSPLVLLKDSAGNPYIAVNSNGQGRAVLVQQPYARLSYSGNPPSFGGERLGSPRDSYVTLLVNAIFYAAHDERMLPVIWESSYSGQQGWNPYLQFSVDGSPGRPVLVWLSNNASVASPFDIHLNGTYYGLSSSGWAAIDVREMSVVSQGTGSDVHLSVSVPPHSWLPIYLVSKQVNLTPVYSTATVTAEKVNGDSVSIAMAGPSNSSRWVVMNSQTAPTSVSSSASQGALPTFSSAASLNGTRIGSVCRSIMPSGRCAGFALYTQQGWYYDAASSLLFVHYLGGRAVSLTISYSQILGGTSTASNMTSASSTTQSSETSSSSTVTSAASGVATETSTLSASSTLTSTSQATSLVSQTSVTLTTSQSSSSATVGGPTTVAAGLGGTNGNLGQAYLLQLDQSSATISPGGSTAAELRVVPGNFGGYVGISVGTTPAGVTASLSPGGGSDGFVSILTIHASNETVPGRYPINISATSQAGGAHLTYWLTVESGIPPPHDVVVQVYDLYGMPVKGASVVISAGNYSLSIVTNSTGVAKFPSVPEGQYLATISYLGASSSFSGNSGVNPNLYVTVALSYPVLITVVAFAAGAVGLTFIWWLRVRARARLRDNLTPFFT